MTASERVAPAESLAQQEDVSWRFALYSQSAVNVTGLAYSMHELGARLIREGMGTDRVNRDPRMQLYASQIHELAGMGFSDLDRYGEAVASVRLQEERQRKGAER